MKTAFITLTVLVSIATPSLATDSLHLLAQVSHTQAQNASEDLKSEQEVKSTKMEAQLNSKSVNPIVISRDRGQ